MIRRLLRLIALGLSWLLALGCAAWAFGALHYDFPFGRAPIAWAFLIVLLAVVVLLHGAWRKIGAVFAAFSLVLTWWLTLKPSNQGDWQPNVTQLARAEVSG